MVKWLTELIPMPQVPHWYTLREAWKAEIGFEEVVSFIRKNGFRRRYGKSWYIYLDIDGFMYWTMGAPLPETIIINRAVIDRC